MRWYKEIPKEPGWYWVRASYESKPHIIRLHRDDNYPPLINYSGVNGDFLVPSEWGLWGDKIEEPTS